MDQNRVDKTQANTPSPNQWSHTWKHDETWPIWLRHAYNIRMGEWHVTPKLIPGHKKG